MDETNGPRFLISRLSSFGDTVCSLPAAVALKRTFPGCHVTWVVDPRFARVVECCGAVDEVVAIKPGLRSIPRFEGRFEAALDLQGLLKSAACIARSKAKRKVGYHWQREGARFFSERILPDPSSVHVVDQYVDVARAVGAEMDWAQFDLKPKHEDVLSVRAKLKAQGQVGRFVAMNSGAGWASKRWPPASFATLIDGLSREGMPTVLIGGMHDLDGASEVMRTCEVKPFSLVGETTLGELMAAIRLSSAHVGGDTGTTHAAAAMDIAAIGLYSITHPQRSCPYGQIGRCHYDSGGLTNIRPEDVIRSVLDAVT